MEKNEILKRLNSMFEEIERKGGRGHSDYWANETRNLSISAIDLINKYDAEGHELVLERKAQAISYLKKAIQYADKYYEDGWDYKNKVNPNVQPHKFINPAYDGLELFLYTVDGSFHRR